MRLTDTLLVTVGEGEIETELHAVALCKADGDALVQALGWALAVGGEDGGAEGEPRGLGVELADALVQAVLERECALDSDAVEQCEALALELIETVDDSERDKVVVSVAELHAVAQCETEGEALPGALRMGLKDGSEDGGAEGEPRGLGVGLADALVQAVLERECALDSDAVAQCVALALELIETSDDSERDKVVDSVAELHAVAQCEAGGEALPGALGEVLEDGSEDGGAEGEPRGLGVGLTDALVQAVLERECALDSDAVAQRETLAHELIVAQVDAEGDRVTEKVAQCEDVALAGALALTLLADAVAEGRLLGVAEKETESVPPDEGVAELKALSEGEGEGRAVEHAETVSEREQPPLWLAWLAVSVVLVVALREAQLAVAQTEGAPLALALLGVAVLLGKLALAL